MSATEPVLRVDGLSVHHRVGRNLIGGSSSTLVAVDDVSFEVLPGETFGVVGESGSGKSTLARAVIGLLPAASGSITVDGHPVVPERAALARVRRAAQMVFQDASASLDARMTVGDLLEEPLIIHRIGDAAERRRRVSHILTQVGLDPVLASRLPKQLSGGQRQRVGVARALIVEPKLVILDEPVSAVDVSVQAQMLNLLAELRASTGVAYLFIVHDLAVAEYFCQRLVVMYRGAVMEAGTSEQLFDNVAHPYTAALLSAVPIPDPARRRMSTWIPLADSAEAGDLGGGCRFRSRCPVGRDDERCRASEPPLTEVAPGHLSRCHYPGRAVPVEVTQPSTATAARTADPTIASVADDT